MLLIPDKTAAHLRGRVTHPSIILNRTTVKNNMDLLRSYVRGSSLHVDADHFLVKLLSSLPLNSEAEPFELGFMMKGAINRIAPAHGLTHHNNVGKPIEGGVLAGDQEFYIVVDTPFTSKDDWRDLRPIEFLYHERSAMSYRFDLESEATVAFLSINLTMLAWQYVQWREAKALFNAEETVLEYIHKYVIHNAMESYNDIAFFNRHLSAITSNPVEREVPRRDIKLVDNVDKLDRQVSNNLVNLMRKTLTIPEVLHQIETPHRDSIVDSLTEYDMATTLQSDWLLMVREMPYLRYALSGKKQGNVNSRYKGSIKRNLVAMHRTRIWDKLPKQLSLHIMDNYYEPLLELVSG